MTDVQHDVAAPARTNAGNDNSQTTEAATARSWSIANPRRVRLP